MVRLCGTRDENGERSRVAVSVSVDMSWRSGCFHTSE